MNPEWREFSIDEIKSKKRYALAMGPFGSNIKSSNFVSAGVPIIRGNNLNANRFLDEDFVFLTEQKADELKGSNAFAGDLIFTHRGTLGQVGIIPNNPKYTRYVVSQSQMKLTVDSEIADPYYIFYYFRSPVGQNSLLSYASTTGVPALSSPLTSLRGIKLPLPPLPVQQKIASILGALDDKIELNRRMNRTLESIVQTLFKHMFIDNPEREGWEKKPLSEIAVFLNGLALQKYPPKGDDYLPVIKIAQLHKGNSEGADKAGTDIPPEYVINDGDIIFSWSGSLEVVIWCGGKGALNQHLFKVTSEKYPKWFYYFWIKHFLPEFQEIASGKATTMGHIQRHHLDDSLLSIPPYDILKKSDSIIAPFLNLSILNSIENKSFSSIRDILLNKIFRKL